ncbi:MAG: hypothetical protein V2I63_02635 [Pseudomonadales bacterium]|jgi:hypothetical protein|nr:hypothetical protein [Pseudomonadales bacterium]
MRWITALLLWAATPSFAAQTPWRVEEGVDAMSDRRILSAYTRVDAGRAGEHALMLRCAGGKLIGSIGTGDYISTLGDQARTLIRWDDDLPINGQLRISHSSNAVLLEDADDFAAGLRDRGRLRARVFRPDGSYIDLDFSLDGSAGPVDAVLEACR